MTNSCLLNPSSDPYNPFRSTVDELPSTRFSHIHGGHFIFSWESSLTFGLESKPHSPQPQRRWNRRFLLNDLVKADATPRVMANQQKKTRARLNKCTLENNQGLERDLVQVENRSKSTSPTPSLTHSPSSSFSSSSSISSWTPMEARMPSLTSVSSPLPSDCLQFGVKIAPAAVNGRQKSHGSSISSVYSSVYSKQVTKTSPENNVDSTTCDRMGTSSSNGNSTNMLQNYKTEFCTKFQESGHCPFEDRCQFVHYAHELQRRNRSLTYKTRPCWSGVDCPYQQNHSRCIYLHGYETAEMFDQQRGISFAKVQKILANKEMKQLRQQYLQRQWYPTFPPLQKEMTVSSCSRQSTTIEVRKEIVQYGKPTHCRQSIVGADCYRPDRFASLTESGPCALVRDARSNPEAHDLFSSFSSFSSLSSSSSCSSPKKRSRSTTTLKPLTIMPPVSIRSPFAPLNDKDPKNISTLATMPDLFSPGVMPAIKIPFFSSHDQIHEWKDPCFVEEDKNAQWGESNEPDDWMDIGEEEYTFFIPTPVTRSTLVDDHRSVKTPLRQTHAETSNRNAPFGLSVPWDAPSTNDDPRRSSCKPNGCYELW